MRYKGYDVKVLKLVILGLLGNFLLACTQTVIVYKPPKHIDPMPILESEARRVSQSQGPDPLNKDQWGLERVGINKQELSENPDLKGNYNIRVAILSTGIDYNHKDLIGQVHINRDEITKEGLADRKSINQKDDDNNGLIDDIVGYDVVDNDGLAYDRHGAGTAVAGIIAAKTNNSVGVSGIMKEVSLYPIRYINENGQTNLANLLKALDVALTAKPHVIFIQQMQLQLGGERSEPGQAAAEVALLKAKLNKFRQEKTPIVIGAGEDVEAFGGNSIDKILREYDNIIIVTSSDKEDDLAFIARHSFTAVHTAAPGEDILTTQPHDKYGEVSGTAYAAAHVAAALALAKAKYGNKKSTSDLVSALISEDGGDYVRSLDRYSRGGNRLNIVKYLSSLGK